ncbi:MAG: carboxypeptidase-like regulatory domain-containing protein, partial [Thermoleophilia bacterium]
MSAWRDNSLPRFIKTLLPVVSFFAIVVTILAVLGFGTSSEMPAAGFNTESGTLLDESPQGGLIDAVATTPAAANALDNELTDNSYQDNSLFFDCCEPDTPVIGTQPLFPPLPPGYVDPFDDGFLPGGPLSLNGYWTISGRVTDPWGRGIAGVGINATPFNNNNIGPLPRPFETDADGYYTVEFGPVWPPDVMAASKYTIYFAGPRSATYGWVNEWYNNTRDANLATPVPLGSQG